MASFYKINPIDMGVYRNVASEGKSLSELFKEATTNGATSAKYGVYFDAVARDDKYLIIVRNAATGEGASAKYFTIKAGNHKVFGGNDLKVTDLAVGDYTFVQVDSGKFLQVDESLKDEANVSSVKGCIIIEGESDAIEVCVVKMPL